MQFRHTLPPDDAGQRLDRFLRKAFQATPLSLLQKALRKGKVNVNGKRVRDGKRPLEAGDTVEVFGIDLKTVTPMRDRARALEQDLTPLILQEDKDYVILNKPDGLPVHPGAKHDDLTLIDLIKARYMKDRAPLTFEPSLVHRLDKGVSGVILAALNAEALRLGAEHFRNGTIQKEYLALVEGHFSESRGEINTPIPDKQGRPLESLTRYRVLRVCGPCTLLSVTLMTGRTHQIRRHFSGVGHPIAGDTNYGGRKAPRIMLHSHRLEFVNSLTGRTIVAVAPMPELMTNFLTKTERERSTPAKPAVISAGNGPAADPPAVSSRFDRR